MNELNVQYYDRVAPLYYFFFGDLAKSMEDEGAWLETILGPRSVRTVLDASCGSGRQTIPLARRGYDVVGSDASAEMLRIGRAAARASGVRFRTCLASFLDLPHLFEGEFDAAITLGNGLCHCETSEEILAALTALRHCCRPGGVCVVGIKQYARIRAERPRLHLHGTLEREGRRVQLVELWDYDDPLLRVTAMLVERESRGRSTEIAIAHEYMLVAEDLEELALCAGFARAVQVHHPCEVVFVLENQPE